MVYRDRKCFIHLALAVLVTVVFSVFSADAGVEIETETLSKFDVFEADIRDVFRSLAELGDLNVLLDKDVTGIVTINLKHGLTIGEAMELLARTYGYSYRWNIPRRTIIIGSEQTFAGWEERETRVYQLRYAASEEVVHALGVVIPQEQIGVDERTNQLTINAGVLEHQNIEEIMERLDCRMPQINIEARVQEINLDTSRELGITWSFPEFGIDSALRFHLVTGQTLRALEEEGAARLLANPNISTTDGQEGRIFIGDRLPVITSRIVDGRIEDVITYVEAGTILTVIPKINDEKTVTVTVTAEVSNIVSWRTGATGTEVPVVRTREASSVVRLQEGETFVLSGLNMQQDVEHMTAVPFLSKLPFFGKLFQSESDEWEDTEICIFLTPYIVRPAEEEYSQVSVATEKDVEISDYPDYQETVEGELSAGPFFDSGDDEFLPGTPLAEEFLPKTQELEIEVVWPAGNEIMEREIMGPVGDGEEEAGTEQVGDEEEKAWAKPGDKYYEDYLARMEERRQRAGTSDRERPTRQPREESGESDIEIPEPGIKITYQVKEGETVLTIAQKYGILPESIKAENDLTDSGPLSAGGQLVLPIPESHLYKLGPQETLWRLARRYDVTVEDLMEINNITDATVLQTGRVIILPVPVEQVVDVNF